MQAKWLIALKLGACSNAPDANPEAGECVGQRAADAVEATLTMHLALGGGTRLEYRLCPASGTTPSVLTLSRTVTRDGELDEGMRTPLSATDYATLVARFRDAVMAKDAGTRSDIVTVDGVQVCIDMKPSSRRLPVCFDNPQRDSLRRGLRPVVDLKAEPNRFADPGSATWSKR